MKIALAPTIAVAAFCALQAQSDEPAQQAKGPAVAAAPVTEKQLIETLREAYDLAMAEATGERSDLSTAMRLDERLYEAEVNFIDASKRVEVVKAHLSRAKTIEEIAQRKVQHGTGMRHELLETKAFRLAAELEVAKLGTTGQSSQALESSSGKVTHIIHKGDGKDVLIYEDNKIYPVTYSLSDLPVWTKDGGSYNPKMLEQHLKSMINFKHMQPASTMSFDSVNSRLIIATNKQLHQLISEVFEELQASSVELDKVKTFDAKESLE